MRHRRRRRTETEERARLRHVVADAGLVLRDAARVRRDAEPFVQSMSDPPEWLRCPVCHHVVPDHADSCVLRPKLSAPRGGIEYLRARGFAAPDLTVPAGTPLYDDLAAERRIDPCRESMVRRNEETFRELSERFARSYATPGAMIVMPDAAKVEVTDPVVEHARELYHLGHFGDVGTLTARRALARMISGRALDEAARPRYRSGWGQPFERTDS